MKTSKPEKLAVYAALAATAGIIVLHCCVSAHAQEFPVVTSVEADYIGVGVGFVPDYTGSDDYTWGVLPAFRYEFGDHRNVELIGNYVSANLIDDEVLRFGPAFRYRFGRDDVDDTAVDAMADIDGTIEGGFKVEGSWVLNNDPRNRFSVGVDALWDLGDTSEGFTSTANIRYWAPVSEAIDLGIAGNVQYADSKYNDTYFGINAADSAASGLPMFSADSGVTSFSITPMAVFHVSPEWHIGAGIRYQRLAGDASDSPIVDDRGDADQWIGGIGVIYSWGMGAHTR